MSKYFALCLLVICACSPADTNEDVTAQETSTNSFTWDNATIYFLLVDRFNNADSANDVTMGRTREAAVARGFMGGDIQGITEKIEEGYFNDLGINAIWFTPPVEQVRGLVNEGTGSTYGYHGYWARDWTTLDPNFGTMADLARMVETAHAHGIRIILDVVLNHTGPVTDEDPQWPEEWVRTAPVCTYMDAESTISCTLVENLPDIRTEKEEGVELPDFLVAKWKEEGRYEQEIQELDEFFARTNYPRAPKYYIIKWLTDYIRELGIDGFRVDTAKHVEDDVWGILFAEAVQAFDDWKGDHPDRVLDDEEFYMMGEVYNYVISHGTAFPMGNGVNVNFYDDGFHSLINFAFKQDARDNLDSVYSSYSEALHSGALQGKSVVNYISSHDDGGPFDRDRSYPRDAGTRLLLAPGAAQVYYGDELARPLMVPGAQGDAHLRSFMNWEALEGEGRDIFNHWARLGRFRRDHPAVGAGQHVTIARSPFVFSRVLENEEMQDRVLIALNASGKVPVNGVFAEGTRLRDSYSGKSYTVSDDSVMLDGMAEVVLLSE